MKFRFAIVAAAAAPWLAEFFEPAAGVEPAVAPKPRAGAVSEPAVPPVEDLRADGGTASVAMFVLPDEGGDPSRPVVAARAVRYVMIRGAWPAKMVRRTSGVEPADFELQRQVVGSCEVEGDAAWEKVDVDLFRDLLANAAEFADEGSGSASNAVVTAPLPKRMDGAWGDESSHPRLTESREGELVLFRCADLGVLPGERYRYRVRLTVIEPGYFVPSGGVARPRFVPGRKRWTDWSVPTEPAGVEP